MANSIEMKAYEGQINLPLLNDIVTFVIDAAKADYTQKEAIVNRFVSEWGGRA